MHILIIRPGAIGDALLAFPVIHALRTLYHHSHITLVSNAAVLSLAREYGIADEVFDYGAAQWSELFLTTRPHTSHTSHRTSHTSALQDLLQRTDLAICWLRDSDGIVAHNLRTAGIKEIMIAPGRPTTDERIHITQYLARTAGIQDTVDTQWILPTHIPNTVCPLSSSLCCYSSW